MRVARRWMMCAIVATGPILSSCSIPTDTPEWDTRWIVPADDTVIEVSQFLPDNVAVTADGAAFAVHIEPFSFSKSLGEACPSCGAWSGQTVPKPAFQMSLEGSTGLPADVISVTVAEIAVTVRVTNGFTFDPIRPGLGNTGDIVLQLYGGETGETMLDEVSVDGVTESFPAGSTLTETLDVPGGSEASRFRVVVLLDSPAGDSVLVDPDDRVNVEVTPATVRVASARIEVASREITADPVELDTADTESDIVDHIQSGALGFFVENPFGVGAELVVRITGSFPDITKSASFSAEPASTTRVEFTGEEMRTFLGKSHVLLSGTGTVSPAAAPITVTPRDTLQLDTRLDVVVRVGK